MNPTSFDVFLSYSHSEKDKPRVRRLAERLRSAGLQVWFDERSIEPGDNIHLAIEDGLEAARTLVFCMSPEALLSEWVMLERSIAQSRSLLDKSRRFIPLLLVDCEIPDSLKVYKYVDFREETQEAFEELLTVSRSSGTADAAPTTAPGALLPGSPTPPSPPAGTAVSPVLDGFWRSLSPELRQALEGHLSFTKRLGREEPDNEDDYIKLRRSFLENGEELLQELLQKTQLCQPDGFNLGWMEIRHEVGRIFLEKRRGKEALDVLGGMQELLERSSEAMRKNKRLSAKMFDSIGEAVRFGPESDTRRAKELFKLALTLSSNDHFALKHLGTVYRIEHRYEEAEKCFKDALKRKQTHHVYFSLGYLYSEWENKDSAAALAREQYEECEKVIKRKQIKGYYRVCLKKAFLALRQDNATAAMTAALDALNVLSESSSDAYVQVSRFAADLLLAVLYEDMAGKELRLRQCEDYLDTEIDGMSLAVFDCVYRDLKREINAKDSVLSTRVAQLRQRRRDLAEKFDRIVESLLTKNLLFQHQGQNTALVRSGSSLAVFPRLDGEVAVYLKLLPGRESQVKPALEQFHEIHRAADNDPYSLKLSFEGVARQPSGAFRQVSKALELLLDHAALVALDKAESTHFDFDGSLWQPFTALVSPSLYKYGFLDHFALPEQHGRNRLVRIFSPKLVGADAGRKGKRVFLNHWVGCSLRCKFCYLPAYGIPIDQGGELEKHVVDISSLVRALEAKEDCFVRGPAGSLLSVGSFTEPFLAPQATLDLLRSLAKLDNPMQIATRVFPGAETLRRLEEDLGTAADRLMINLSMNDPAAAVQSFVDKWMTHKGRLNVTVYVKPFLDRTRDCFGYFERLGRERQEVSFVVGSLYFGDKVGLKAEEIRNHLPEPALKSPVVPRPTTPGMRNNAEEDFRASLERRLGRTVFRTSSCALAAKMRIPDPLGNYGGPFCVAGCSNDAVCRAAYGAPGQIASLPT